jgi:hypothetical protein
MKYFLASFLLISSTAFADFPFPAQLPADVSTCYLTLTGARDYHPTGRISCDGAPQIKFSTKHSYSSFDQAVSGLFDTLKSLNITYQVYPGPGFGYSYYDDNIAVEFDAEGKTLPVAPTEAPDDTSDASSLGFWPFF